MLSALFVAGNPELWRNAFDKKLAPVEQIHAEWEFSEIAMALLRPISLGAISIRQSAGMSVSDVIECLHTEKPDILHLACHANESMLLLANDARLAHEIEEKTLGDLIFSLCSPRCVYLNGCHTAHIADQWADRYRVAVIGNEGEISSDAAAKGSTAFYRHLGYGQSILGSLQFANTAMGGYGANHGHSKVRLGASKQSPSHIITRPLIKLPELVAKAQRLKGGNFEVLVGVKNVPIETTALCFLSDDETIESSGRQYHQYIISVPSEPEWIVRKFVVNGSFRFAIMGMTTEPKHAWCLQSTLSRVLHSCGCDLGLIAELVAGGSILEDQTLGDLIAELLDRQKSENLAYMR